MRPSILGVEKDDEKSDDDMKGALSFNPLLE